MFGHDEWRAPSHGEEKLGHPGDERKKKRGWCSPLPFHHPPAQTGHSCRTHIPTPSVCWEGRRERERRGDVALTLRSLSLCSTPLSGRPCRSEVPKWPHCEGVTMYGSAGAPRCEVAGNGQFTSTTCGVALTPSPSTGGESESPSTTWPCDSHTAPTKKQEVRGKWGVGGVFFLQRSRLGFSVG